MTTDAAEPKVLDNLTEQEAYLFALLSDPSGLDQAEFLWVDDSSEDNLFCPHCETNRNGVALPAARAAHPSRHAASARRYDEHSAPARRPSSGNRSVFDTR